MNRIINLCRRAENLKDKVIEQGRTDSKIYFSFKDITDPPVICIHTNGKYTYLESCTCKAHSILGGMPEINMKNLCVYILAVYKSLGK